MKSKLVIVLSVVGVLGPAGTAMAVNSDILMSAPVGLVGQATTLLEPVSAATDAPTSPAVEPSEAPERVADVPEKPAAPEAPDPAEESPESDVVRAAAPLAAAPAPAAPVARGRERPTRGPRR